MKQLTMRIQKQDNLNDVFIIDDEAGNGGAYHNYLVVKKDAATEDKETGTILLDPNDILLQVGFQDGPRAVEGSIPGVLEGDLLEIVRHRLQCFQKGPFSTRDNACALTHIEEALMWLNKRQADRKERGVLGTNNK